MTGISTVRGRRTSKKSTTSRSKSTKRKRRKTSRSMPVWLRNVLALFLILAFSASFYYFFIRPYAYRWKPCGGQKEYGVCMPCCYDVHGIDVSHYQGRI
ncbi:MAG: glycoside hydrolase family 25 protein, partial [Bacteroides sp.]